ncbi:hypothetical protein [Acidaminococcus sp.]|uniref:hypothetical protein n=1 Tax=Acidaminococcus sp. TaxID=1872103 RepID=UPI00351F912E
MKKQPKNAPWPVSLILLSVMMAMTLWELAGWLVSIVWDGLQQLGPRFQGVIIGVWATMMLFWLAASLAVFG